MAWPRAPKPRFRSEPGQAKQKGRGSRSRKPAAGGGDHVRHASRRGDGGHPTVDGRPACRIGLGSSAWRPGLAWHGAVVCDATRYAYPQRARVQPTAPGPPQTHAPGGAGAVVSSHPDARPPPL
ncbi:hypothetical protein SEVIR_2G379550v4 [Setaria viridis]